MLAISSVANKETVNCSVESVVLRFMHNKIFFFKSITYSPIMMVGKLQLMRRKDKKEVIIYKKEKKID